LRWPPDRAPDPANRSRCCRGPRPDLRGVLAHRLAKLDRWRALLVLDRDPFGCVLCSDERFGDHHCDRLADMPNGFSGERWAMRHDELAAVASRERRMLRDIADPLHVGRRQDGQHAGNCPCSRGIDGSDVGEGVRRAHEAGLNLPGHGVVGRKVSEAAHQGVVLQARLVRRAACTGH
jgi:hypothetical protein